MSSRERIQFGDFTEPQMELLLEFVACAGTLIVSRSRGPIPLWQFSQQIIEHTRLELPVDLASFCDAVKTLLRKMDHPRLRLMSHGGMPGVGYVYDAANPDTWPVRSSFTI